MLTAIGAILMVLGMAALVKVPILGALLIGIGYACYSKATPSQRSATASLFFGICLVAMVIVGAVAVLGVAFG
jgi:hypothetical protein